MKKTILKYAVFFCGIVIVAWFLSEFVVLRTHVNGDSMAPTLQNGDSLLIDRISYRFREPKRFDIIVFPYQYRENTYFIKRIVGLPGERIRISEGRIYINGEALEEDYGSGLAEEGGLASYEVRLEENEYFVLGDNRNASQDSREPGVGNIQKEQIIGKAFFRLFPFADFGRIR